MKNLCIPLFVLVIVTEETFAQAPVPSPDAIFKEAFDTSKLIVTKSNGHPFLAAAEGTKIGDALVEFSNKMKSSIGADVTASFKRKGVTVRWGKDSGLTSGPREILVVTTLDDGSALAESDSEKTAIYAVAGRTGDATAVTLGLAGPGSLGSGDSALAIAGDGILDGTEKGGDAEASGRVEANALAGRGRGNGQGGDARAMIAPGGKGASAYGGDGGSLGGRGGDSLVETDLVVFNVPTGLMHAEGGRGWAIGARGGHASAFNSEGIAEAVGGDSGEGAGGGTAHAVSGGEARAAGGSSALTGISLLGGDGGFAIATSVNSLAQAWGGNGGQGFFGGAGGRAFAESDHADALAIGGIGGSGVFGGPGGNGVADANGGKAAHGEGGTGGLCLHANGGGGPGGRGYAAGFTLAEAIGGVGGDAPVANGTAGAGGDVMGMAAAGAPLLLAPGFSGTAPNPGGAGVVLPFIYPPPPGF